MRIKEIRLSIAIALFYLAWLVLWQLFADDYFTLWVRIFPKPSTIVASMVRHRELLWLGTVETLYQAVIGLFLGAVVAFVLAIVLEPLPWLARLLYPLLYAWQASPPIATTTLVLLLLGFGTTSKLVIVVLVTFFPIYVGFSQALAKSDREVEALLRSYGASRWQIFRMARWPMAMVGFFSGVRVSATYLISVVITAQWLGGQDGLGNTLLRSRKSYDYALMMATIALSIGLSLLIIFISSQLEQRVMRRYHLIDKEERT